MEKEGQRRRSLPGASGRAAQARLLAAEGDADPHRRHRRHVRLRKRRLPKGTLPPPLRLFDARLAQDSPVGVG